MLRTFAVACFAFAGLAACSGQAQQRHVAVRERKNFPDNVCAYVAKAFQAGRIREVARETGELVRADGTKAEFAALDGGTAHMPYLASPDGGDLPDKFYVPEKLWTWDDLYIVPYGGRSYVVHADEGELKSVSEPNVGVTCQFNVEVASKLVTNHAPAICRKLEKDDSWDFPELTGQATSADDSGPGDPMITSTTRYDLQGGPATISHYEYSSDAGSGCKYSGLFFVKDRKEEDTPRNAALRSAQEAVADCGTSTTMLVSIDGEILLKLTGRIGGRTGTHTRRLMRFKGDQIEELCRVDELRSYTPR